MSKKQRLRSWYERGQAAGSQIRFAASELTKYILERDESKAKEKLGAIELLTFTSALYYIRLDRESFAHLREPQRSDFSKGMQDQIAVGLSELWTSPRAIYPTVVIEINKGMRQLAPFAAEPNPETDDHPKETLYNAFARLLDKQYGVDHEIALASQALAIQIGLKLLRAVKDLLSEDRKATIDGEMAR